MNTREVRLRCIRKTSTRHGGQTQTERSFVSVDENQMQMNEGVYASYKETLVGDEEDTSVNLHDVVVFTIPVI